MIFMPGNCEKKRGTQSKPLRTGKTESHVFVNVSSLYLVLSQRKKNSVLFSQSFEKE